MIIRPKIFQEPSDGVKRDFQTYDRDQRAAQKDFEVTETHLRERRPINPGKQPERTSKALVEPSNLEKVKQPAPSYGAPSMQFRSFDELYRAHGEEFIPYGKPLVYLENHDRTIFVLARTYVMGWKSESNAELLHQGRLARDINMVVSFVHPKTLMPVSVGPISATSFEDGKNLIPALAMLPGGSNEILQREEEFSLLARCMYCFDVGQHVPADSAVAESLQKNMSVDGFATGINLAMHHAAANDDTRQATYFLEKGGDPREVWDGNHQDSLEEALKNNNHELISSFLGKMSKKDLSYMQDLIHPNQVQKYKESHLVKERIDILSRKSSNHP